MIDRARPRSASRALLGSGRLARALFVFVSAVVLLAQGLCLGHMVFFRHERCAHGELVHSGHRHAVADAAVAGDDDRAAMRPGEADESDHDHCNPFAVTPFVVTAPSAAAGPRASLAPSFERLHASGAEPQVALLLLAPKNSPNV
jgi:hypothetical protein